MYTALYSLLFPLILGFDLFSQNNFLSGKLLSDFVDLSHRIFLSNKLEKKFTPHISVIPDTTEFDVRLIQNHSETETISFQRHKEPILNIHFIVVMISLESSLVK